MVAAYAKDIPGYRSSGKIQLTVARSGGDKKILDAAFNIVHSIRASAFNRALACLSFRDT